MDSAARTQIRLILENADDLARTALRSRIEAIYADHSARGLLRSGVTVKVCVRAMEENANGLITRNIDQVSSVAKDTEAFAMIGEATQLFLTFLTNELDDVVAMATGGIGNPAIFDSIDGAAKKHLSEATKRLLRQLELHRFSFIVPSPLPSQTLLQSLPAPPVPKGKGGRIPAAFWDDLWAFIANALYQGDLKPKRQADIEKAMAEWIAANGLDAASSTIRGRARRLWDLIEQSPH